MAETKSFVKVSAGRLAYLEVGSGPTVIFIHGIPTSSDLWHDVLPRLIDRFHIYAIDMIGYGDSDKPEQASLSVSAQVDYLREFVQHVGIGRAAIVGHDIGGAVAQIYAVRYADLVDRLVLIDTASYDSWPVPDIDRLKEPTWDATFERLDLSRGFRRAFERGMAHKEKVTDDLVDRYARPFSDRDGRFAYLRAARALNSQDTMSVAQEIEQISVPVLLLWGRQDDYQPLSYGERLAQRLPNAKLVALEDGGHFLPEDCPEDVARHIGEFLAMPG